MAELYPLKLAPVAKSAIWGGERLKTEWNKQAPLENVAETWELTVREKENNIVQNGTLAGKTLADVLRKWGKSAIGAAYTAERFPLLVKFIDAADRLSVQVHPDDAFASAVENDLGKTEVWYVVEADEGASILWGLAEGVTERDFAAAVQTGETEKLLRRVEVKKGDVYFIPARMPHAIGAGILIAEIQQNCDLTYRVFDYNRRDKEGKLRELHVEKALQVVRPFTEAEVDAVRYARGRATPDVLVNCPYFSVRHVKVNGERAEAVPRESFVSLLALAGAGYVQAGAHRVPFEKGESLFLPAGLGEYRLVGEAELLLSTM